MKISRLKVGDTYYMSSCSMHSYKKVTLLEIIDLKHVKLMDKKKKVFITNVSKLHKTPDKAVEGLRHQEAIRREMKKQKNRMVQKEKESLVTKSIQKKVKQLRSKAFATIENDTYVIKGYVKNLKFNTLDEMVAWIDTELELYTKFKKEILSKGYRLLKIKFENGTCSYFYKLCLNFSNRTISCRGFKGDIEEFATEQILDWNYIYDTYGMKMSVKEE